MVEDKRPEATTREKPLSEPPEIDPSPPETPGLNQARRVWLGMVALYAVAVLLLASLGLFGFIWKTVVVPALFLGAALMGRLRGFVRDWAVFMGAIILFDSLRGLIYALINRFELPVYMVYAIDWERAMLGGRTLPEIFQQAWLDPESVGLFERFLVVVHASHFLFFFFFGMLIWLVRSEEFGRFKLAMVLMMYSGLVGYILVPTVPPWMAAAVYEVLPPIQHVTAYLYNLSIPTLQQSFDTNPIAAMPSLHSAFPALMTMIALHSFRLRGWPMALYTSLVFLAVTCLGEHYLVDVLAGVALAAACYVVAYRFDAVAGRLGATSPPPEPTGGEPPVWQDAALRTRVLLMALLLILGEAAGLWARNSHWPYAPDFAFVERELNGRSPLADFYRGRRAFKEGDFVLAQQALSRGLPRLTQADHARLSWFLLGQSAFRNEDWPAVVDNLGRLSKRSLGPRVGLMLAQAHLHLGHESEGFAVLDELAASFGERPDFRYWKSVLEHQHGRISDEEYQARLEELEGASTELPDDPR